ncbi:MAG: IS1634 family transposase [Nitrososphaerales archaeon]
MARGVGGTPFQLESRTVGALPIVGAFVDRLGLSDMLEEVLPTDPRAQLSAAQSLGVMLANIVCERVPLYALGEWVETCDEVALGLGAGEGVLINDDRVGRALDRLFDADRAALVTRIALSAIGHFSVATDELHNDSTSITLQGDYHEAGGQAVRGKPTVAAARGHSKDHRPDLKQLLWVLTVSADFAVPVHYRLYDGNTADTEPHTEIWDTLVALVGRPGFLYVADSKLATSENMAHIDRHGGRFLSVLPRTRSEDADFRQWVRDHDPDWVFVRDSGTDNEGVRDAYLMCDVPWPSKEGHRVAWVLSTAKRHHDAERRRARLTAATESLEELATRLVAPKARIRTIDGATKAVEAILAETGTADYFEIRLSERTEATFRQEQRGRPGIDTRYRRSDRTRIALEFSIRHDEIAGQAASDGMFPFITNDRDLTLGDLLEHYKYQPCLERRHEQLKTGLEVVPLWLKRIHRIEAILLLYYVALLIRALMEREIRRNMKDQDIAALPMYPEDRNCPAPSAERILAIFSNLQRHELVAEGKTIEVFEPELDKLQRRVLKLLGLSPAIYRDPSE